LAAMGLHMEALNQFLQVRNQQKILFFFW
jgi:hypothetical protein